MNLSEATVSRNSILFCFSWLFLLQAACGLENAKVDPTTKSQISDPGSKDSCPPVDLASPGFDCNGRSLNYPEKLFSFYSVHDPKKQLSDYELDQANDVLVCSLQGPKMCEQICVNQAFNFRERFAVLKTGYLWPNGSCSFLLLGHQNESGLSQYSWYWGQYQANEGSVLGQCRGINVEKPDESGRYFFKEERLDSGVISPAPNHSRLYFTLNLLKEPNGYQEEIILENYQPMQDSTAVYMMDIPVGRTSAHFSQVPGFGCIKKTQFNQESISTIR